MENKPSSFETKGVNLRIAVEEPWFPSKLFVKKKKQERKELKTGKQERS